MYSSPMYNFVVVIVNWRHFLLFPVNRSNNLHMFGSQLNYTLLIIRFIHENATLNLGKQSWSFKLWLQIFCHINQINRHKYGKGKH